MYTFHQEDIKYISAFVRKRGSNLHSIKRGSFCIKAIMLFIESLCHQGLETDTEVHVWSILFKYILFSGCDRFSLSKGDEVEIDKGQTIYTLCGAMFFLSNKKLVQQRMENKYFVQILVGKKLDHEMRETFCFLAC